MIIEELVLEDFGAYAGVQSIELSPAAEDSPVVLVGGQNGEGKTTILEAVLLTLYGPHAGQITERSGSYDKYLLSRINHEADPEKGAAVELSLRVTRDGSREQIRVRRSWARTARGARERLSVWRDGKADPQLGEGWSEFVETLVPRGVAPLFFFDGERIEGLADLDTAAETLRTAVGALLGLELVDQLGADLRALERRHADKVADEELKDEIDGTGRELEQAEASVVESRQRLAEARARAEHAAARLRRAEQEFRAQGGESYETRSERERALEAARTRLTSARTRLRELAAGPAPLLLTGDQLDQLLGRIRAEHTNELAGELVKILQTRDSEILVWAAAEGVGDSERGRLEERMAHDRREREGGGSDPIAQVSSTGQRHLEAVTASVLPNVLEELHRESAAALEARREVEVAERRLAEVPSPDAVESLIALREKARAESVRAVERVSEIDAEMAERERHRERKAETHERVLRRAAEEGLGAEDSQRLMRHAERARSTLAELRQRSAAHHMSRIEKLIGASLDELLRKEGLVEGVGIEPETHELRLTGRRGRKIDPSALSAGERQLTALSLLWGLARASARALPVIIDTPLGRLDASHRSLFVSRYLPHASHQVIVLSTDTEVDRELLGVLNGAVGRSYRLSYDDKTQATEVVPGYFFEEAAAA